LPLSVLILVLMLVSLITVMFYVDYLISLTYCVSLFFVTVYRIDWCIALFSWTAARMFNKLTYLLTAAHYTIVKQYVLRYRHHDHL